MLFSAFIFALFWVCTCLYDVQVYFWLCPGTTQGRTAGGDLIGCQGSVRVAACSASALPAVPPLWPLFSFSKCQAKFPCLGFDHKCRFFLLACFIHWLPLSVDVFTLPENALEWVIHFSLVTKAVKNTDEGSLLIRRGNFYHILASLKQGTLVRPLM